LALPTNSRDVIRLLEQGGWRLKRVRGSHHIYEKAGFSHKIVVPHPRKDLSKPLVRDVLRQAGLDVGGD
jgi:predicted RNA binding protein YcfA (HicA-like mRNA interferase family)